MKGTTYKIAVAGRGHIHELTWRTYTRPVNDQFANATVLNEGQRGVYARESRLRHRPSG